MPNKPIIGIRQLVPILVVDALFMAAIIGVMMAGTGRQPYIGGLTLLETLLIAFVVVSAWLTYATIVRPMRRAQAARKAGVEENVRDSSSRRWER